MRNTLQLRSNSDFPSIFSNNSITRDMSDAFSKFFPTMVGIDGLARGIEDMPFSGTNFPPYNIVKEAEGKYYVEFALAGFSRDDISITQEGEYLVVEGSKNDSTKEVNPVNKLEDYKDEKDKNTETTTEENTDNDGLPAYIHKGISSRKFKNKFKLVDHVKVTNAAMKDGMLRIYLEREIPENLKPKKIKVE